MRGYIDPFERDVGPDEPNELDETHPNEANEGQELEAIIDEIGGLEDDGVSAS